ncbi:LppA family lipoprotein [Mycoplasma mycoides]|uniref:LppA family lipoprotein n=1 Tax=Mycoplasma mycoides TaxID=2102 RepID=UPI002240ABEF|nr:LppA family lipoprotein [Mycoplasma mycoides]QVK06848.1 LppA family lipoprotein [Mycoplasma mycoides subsp. capri]
MKKATKLLLSVLPISSISLLSVVSCSTTNSNAKQPGKTPKIPKVEPKTPKTPENDSTEPSEDPKKPEENQPKKPDDQPQGDSPSNNHPHNDQPADQPEIHKVDFSDVDKLPKEISLEHFTNYKNKSLESAWSDLQKDSTVFSHILFKNLKGYKISFENISSVKFDHSKGVIDNVKIKFTKEGESKTRVFVLTGLKKTDSIEPKEPKNNKDNYIKPKSVDNRLFGLFPSLLAYMLLFVENNKKYEEIQWAKNSINFEQLKNKNTSFFDESFVGFNVGTKELLFEYNENDRTKYEDKITSAKYDDINGELGLEVEITNREESGLTEPRITKRFNFKGFRKANFNNQNDNVLSLSLLPSDLKDLATKGSLKSDVDKAIKSKEFSKKISISNNDFIKNWLFKKIILNVVDNENHIYRDTQSLKLDYSNKGGENNTIIAFNDGTSLYPLHTKIDKDSISDIFITITNEDGQNKLEIEFNVNIPFYASNLSDLTSHSTSKDETLKYKINVSTRID